MEKNVIATVQIPEEVAAELSILLNKQSMYERLLSQALSEPTIDRIKISNIESLLLPINTDLNVLKNTITNTYIPSEYQKSIYVWNYESWAINTDSIQIIRA